MQSAIRRPNPATLATGDVLTGSDIPHISMAEILRLADAAAATAKGTLGDRDGLLIKTMFDGCFRVSELLQLTPRSILHDGNGWAIRIIGKGRKPRIVAISQSLAVALQAHAYRRGIVPPARIFAINRQRVWQIVDRAFTSSGVEKPPHVGSVHVLRHAGAIARLKETRNPVALRDQLGHASMNMSLRYLKTLTRADSLRIQQGVDFQW